MFQIAPHRAHPVAALIGLLIFLGVYFLPAIVAQRRGHLSAG